MRRPRLRFTVRRLMIAVAILALSIRSITWVVELRTRSGTYARRAEEYARSTGRAGSWTTTQDGRVVDLYEDENSRLRDVWACKMAEKYWRLSDYPWLPVEPDIPPPEPLAHPRNAFELPEKTKSESGCWNPYPRPPDWTFLWTWRRWWRPVDSR
jgi:hypothetical protein